MSEQMSREEMLSTLREKAHDLRRHEFDYLAAAERYREVGDDEMVEVYEASAGGFTKTCTALEMAISLLTQKNDTITISRATADVCESALLLFGISLMKTVEASERKKMPESARIGRERAEEVRKAREEIVVALTKEGGNTPQ